MIPDQSNQLDQPVFSADLMANMSNDLKCLQNQIYLTRTFELLYEQSLLFHTYQSYVRFNHAIHYAYELKQSERPTVDVSESAAQFNSYSDLRVCECADYVMTVYIKLVEYHGNLYEIYEKMIDDKRDYLRLKQFDRVMHYRMEICQLLLRCNYLQRLLVEIDNGRKFLEKFQSDTKTQTDFIYHYQYLLVKHRFDLLQAIVLQRTRALQEAKQLCERNLKELNGMYEEKIWDKLIANDDATNHLSAREKRQHFEHSKDNASRECSEELLSSTPSSTTSVSSRTQLVHPRRPHP